MDSDLVVINVKVMGKAAAGTNKLGQTSKDDEGPGRKTVAWRKIRIDSLPARRPFGDYSGDGNPIIAAGDCMNT
jgi:hypothetical protein